MRRLLQFGQRWRGRAVGNRRHRRRDRLGNAVVGDEEVVGGEGEDVLAGFGFDLHGHLHERGAHGEGGGRILSLLGDDKHCRKGQ